MISTSLSSLLARVQALEQRLNSPLNWRGSFVAGTLYILNDVIYSGGITYVCIKTNFNVTPPNTAYWLVLPGADFTNPMIANQDMIVGTTSGVPARLPSAGLNTRVLALNPAGALGYVPYTDVGFPNPMTTPGDIIIGGTSGTAIRVASPSDYTYLRSNPSGGIIWRSTVQLLYDFHATTDFWTGAQTITASTWTTFAGPFNGIVKSSDASMLEIVVRCACFTTTAGNEFSSALYVTYPNATTQRIGLGQTGFSVTNAAGNPFSGSGSVYIPSGGSGPAGSYNFEVQVFTNGGMASGLYCRAASYGNPPQFEWFYIQVIEHF